MVKSESAASMAAVCPGGSTVPATVMIVVEYRLVYQLIGRSQAAKSCLGGSTVPAAVVIVVKHSKLNLSIGHWIAGILARSFGRLDCRRSTVVVWLGSSTVRVTGSFP